MKNGGSSAFAAANAGGGALAITERQKPSCVAALFQMLAKKRLFSSSSSKTKLLAPARAQKFSPGKPPGGGGGEKTPVAKKRPLLLDSADYARSRSEGHGTNRSPPPSQDSNCREMSTPGVVARLMGLSSMPSISHKRSARAADSSEVDGHRNEYSQGLPGSSGDMAARIRMKEKSWQAIDERHGNGSQFNADSQALWLGRHHNHKVGSPLRSPRSISSKNKARLIEAAARVLEPGLQSRNRHRAKRHARLEYPCNGDGAARAAAVMHNLPDQFSRDIHDADAPMSGARKVGGTPLHKSTPNQWSEENGKKVDAARRPSQDMSWQVQPEGNSKVLPVSSSSEKAMFKQSGEMIFNATADTYQDVRKIQPRNVSRGNVASSPLKQNNMKQNALPVASRTEDPQHVIQRQKHRTGEQHVASTGKDFVSLNKSMNNSSSLRSKGKGMDEIRVSHTSAQNKNLSTKVCSKRDELKDRDIPALEKSSSDEFLWELDNLMHGFGELPSPMELRETHKKHEANGKDSNPSRSAPGGNRQQRIPRFAYADENCTSGSANYTSDVQLEDRGRSENSTSAFSARDTSNERNARCAEPNSGQHGAAHRFAPAVQDGKLMMHPGELTSTVDLLLANVCSSGLQRRPKASSKTFLLRTSESVLATLTTSSKKKPVSKAAGANPLRDLASDLVTECLDSMCAKLCDSGYRSFAKLAMVSTEERLADEVRKEAARCGAMAGQDLDDLAASDVERAVEAGMAGALHEALQIVAQIERDLVQELVHEIELDMIRQAVVN